MDGFQLAAYTSDGSYFETVSIVDGFFVFDRLMLLLSLPPQLLSRLLIVVVLARETVVYFHGGFAIAGHSFIE